MQPGEEIKELSGRSQLFDSLKAYLNNKSRLQPIIGLSSIIECVNVGSANRETSYVCEVCVCRLTKADMRNHILGSHHRFNYIKTHHPHLSSRWQESPDLSKLAWPLMELAKTLEGKEGPGYVQLLEVPTAVYQKIATESENNAAALINTLKDEQSKSRSFSDATSLHYPFESERIVLRAHKRRGVPEVLDNADVKPYEILPETEFPPLIPAHQTPESKVRLKSTSKLESMFPEPSVSSENDDFVGDFSGGKPLVGLVRVAELRSENGSSYGFLCHCCRIKSNKNDIFDHLTSYSHLSNYMIENQPDLVSVLNEDTETNFQLLQSLADRVEQQEGRGEPTIINVPESFCRQITGKSYHWCLRMLSNGWVNTNIQRKRETVKGVTKPSMATKITVVMSNQAKREQLQKKRKKKTDTKFNVSLPFLKGAMLLKRTSFNQDNLLELSSSLSDLDQISSPGDGESKRDAAYFENTNAELSSNLQTSQLEQDLCEGDVDSGEFVPKTDIKVTVFQDAKGRDGVHFTQSDKETDTTEEHSGRPYGRQHGAQSLFNDWQNEGAQAEREGLFPAVSHDEAWCPYNSSYGQEEGSSDGWYSSASVQRRENESRQESENNTTPTAVQHYHHQSQQMVWNHSGSGSMWTPQDLPVDVASIVEAARTNVETHSAHSGSVSSQHGEMFHEYEPRQSPSGLGFNSFYTDPRSYMAHCAAPQDQSVNCQNTGPSTNPEPYGTFPASSGHFWGAWMPPNAFIQPAQAVYYGSSSEVYFRTWGPN